METNQFSTAGQTLDSFNRYNVLKRPTTVRTISNDNMLNVQRAMRCYGNGDETKCGIGPMIVTYGWKCQ